MTGAAGPAVRLALAALLAAGLARPARAGSSLRLRYDAADAAAGAWFAGATNEEGTIAWGASYVLLSYVVMYRATGEPAYLDRLCELADRVLAVRDSVRGVVDYAGESNPCWLAGTRYSTQPMCWAVHTGLIAQPMVELAVLVGADPALGARVTYDGATLAAKAAAYVDAGEAAAAVHAAEWRDDGAARGYYVFPPDATFYPHAGDKMPLNQMNAMGLLHVALADATGDAVHRDRATRLANHLVASLEIGPTGGYRWNYWAGAYASPGEDISHAAIEVAFAARAAASGVVFSDAHLRRFATTFTEQIYLDSATTYDHVGGAGATNDSGMRPQVGRWALLAPWDPTVHAVVRQVYDAYATTGSGSLLLGMAYLAATDLPIRPYFFYHVDWEDLGDTRRATAYGANVLAHPVEPAAPHLIRLRYSAARRTEVQQWDGTAYHTVARLAPTGGALVTTYVAYHPGWWFDYASGALYQFADAFVAGQGIVVAEPEVLTPPTITSAPPASARVGEPFAYEAEATGDAPLLWTLAGPPGANVDPVTGAVSWTPSASGDAAFVLSVENDSGRAEQAFTVTAHGQAAPDAATPGPGADGGTGAPDASSAAGPDSGGGDASDGLGGGCGCAAGRGGAPGGPGRGKGAGLALALLAGGALRRRRARSA